MERKRVLVIDDSELVLTMVSDFLTDAGYDVLTASNCIEANQYLYSKDKVHLVLMDVMMPMLGGEATVKIMKNSEMFSSTPIIYISSKPKEELARLAVATGAQGYLHKPFSDNELLAKVKTLIG